VYDPVRLSEVVNEWNTKLPWMKPRYAVKCNPLKCLLSDLDYKGFGFDIASLGELQHMIDLDIDPKKIIYSNPFKDEKALKAAYQYGIRLTVADTIGELKKIQKIAPEMKILWRISITELNKKKDGISFSEKFGDPMNSYGEIASKF